MWINEHESITNCRQDASFVRRFLRMQKHQVLKKVTGIRRWTCTDISYSKKLKYPSSKLKQGRAYTYVGMPSIYDKSKIQLSLHKSNTQTNITERQTYKMIILYFLIGYRNLHQKKFQPSTLHSSREIHVSSIVFLKEGQTFRII